MSGLGQTVELDPPLPPWAIALIVIVVIAAAVIIIIALVTYMKRRDDRIAQRGAKEVNMGEMDYGGRLKVE